MADPVGGVPVVFVAADLAQIEARVLAWLADERGLIEAFRSGQDIYCAFGSEHLFKRPITAADVWERRIAKATVLGCGYGMSGKKFYETCRREDVEISPEMANAAVASYRTAYLGIVGFWRAMDRAIDVLVGRSPPAFIGRLFVEPGRVTLPSGRWLWYHNLGYDPMLDQFTFTPPERGPVGLWYGLLVENITQATARDIIAQSILRSLQLVRDAKLPLWAEPVMMTHDDVVWRVPATAAEKFKPVVQRIMETPPDWARDLPLKCELKIGANYGDL